MLTDNSEQAYIMVAKDTLSFFQKCKSTHINSAITDSDFLQILLGHFDKCTKESRISLSNGFPGFSEHVCPECDFVAENLADMSSHFDSRHSVEASFSCTCGLSYDHMPDFLRHYIECPIAATDLQDPGRLKRPDSPTRLKKYAADGNETRAMELDSPNVVDSYKNPPVVPVSGPSHDKPFGCPHCEKGFKSKSLLEQHMHLHYPPRYKCRWCSKVYRWPPVYYHHMRICKKMQSLKQTCHVDNEQISATDTDISKEDTVENVSESPFSPNKALSSVILQSNNNAALSNSNTLCPSTDPAPNVPPLNNSTGRSNTLELSDSQKFEKNNDFSQTSLKTDESANYSESKFLPGHVKLFTCNICNKEFTSKLSLKQHVDGKHRLEGKYVCQLCGKRYRWGASFYYHRRTCISPSVIDFSATPDVPSLPHHVSQPSA